MQVFVARQAIFDTRQRVVAYELLFRSGLENHFPPGVDSDFASSKVIDDALSTFDFHKLVDGKKAYVNVTRQVLCGGLYSVLPPRQTVIELLESVAADPETLAAVRAARAAGYQIALDDFVARPALAPLVPLAHILKVDFLTTARGKRRFSDERARSPKLTLLAEKVESADEFHDAQSLGYTLFQGYFFQRPEIISREAVPPSKLTYVRFLRELQAPDLDYERIERVIKHDLSLSMKLLKFLNSAAFGWRSRVTSLKHALVLLGERPFRKWASLLAVVGMSDDRPPELALVSLTRARFAEQLCPLVSALAGRELDAFLVGLLSALDAMVGRPLPELLAEIAVSADIDAAILRRDTPLGMLRALVTAYEAGAWSEVAGWAAKLGVAEDALPEISRRAIEWATDTLPR